MPIHAVSVECKFSVREVSLESRVEGRAGWAGAPEMAQRLRPVAAHPEDSSSATALQWPVAPTLRDFPPSSGLLGTCTQAAYGYTHRHGNKIKNKYFKIKWEFKNMLGFPHNLMF